VTNRLVVDLTPDGRILVTAEAQGHAFRAGEGAAPELSWPLDNDAMADLRWYLEDYLQMPYGVYGDRGSKVDGELAQWGEAIFAGLFGEQKARQDYEHMRSLGNLELVFRSSSPAVLGLPWELIKDPARPTPMAVDLAAVSRTLPGGGPPPMLSAPGARLRVLMVISRPAGAADVGYRMVSRRLLGRLSSARGMVDLVVLRPPTIQALGEALTTAAGAGEPFQVVHFDGHGVQASTAAADGHAPWAPRPEGVLVFETAEGGPHEVPASVVAEVLRTGQVPVVVLNACQSAAVGQALEATVATRLLQNGVSSVVAMAYSVYAVAAAEFMTAFYERLFAGDEVGAAVTAGRWRLFDQNMRPSPKGDLPLADWLVPVHYKRQDVSFPQVVVSSADAAPFDAAADQPGELHPPRDDGRAGIDLAGSLAGRDALFYHLERDARLRGVTLLHGIAGCGKTALASAFASWWQQTGGPENPAWVYRHSFEDRPSARDLDDVINDIGLGVLGEDFANLPRDRRHTEVRDLLAKHRIFLIWDNFEAVRSMASQPAPAESHSQDFRDFISFMADAGPSFLLIISRTAESWLGDIARIQLPGLAGAEQTEYVSKLMEPYPSAEPRRATRAFAELLQFLDGHPQTMLLVLPQLETTEPDVLLAELAGSASPRSSPERGGADYLAPVRASIDYSYQHVSEAARRQLAALCLCQRVVSSEVLAFFSNDGQTPQRFKGASGPDWQHALEEAADVGLVTPLGLGLFQLHPGLPSFLAAHWRAEEPADYESQREAALFAMVSAHVIYSGWLVEQTALGDAAFAFRLLDMEASNLTNLLGRAIEFQWWTEAHGIARSLTHYWQARGRDDEAAAWADRVLSATRDPSGGVPDPESPAGQLWLFFAEARANALVESRHLGEGKSWSLEMLGMLESQPRSPETEGTLASTYHRLGMIDQLTGTREDAERWYRKALAISEERNVQLAMAGTYHQLGLLAQDDRRLDEAVTWYKKALSISESMNHMLGMVKTYTQLGAVAASRGQMGEAIQWTAKAVAINGQIGDQPAMATNYQNLGGMARDQKRFGEAEGWYTKALDIYERIGNHYGAADIYRLLGEIAQEKHRLDEAEDWYVRSLTVMTELANQKGMALAAHHLGRLGLLRGALDAAESNLSRSLALYGALGDLPGVAASCYSLGEVNEARDRYDEAVTWYTKALAARQQTNDRNGISGAYYQLGTLAQNHGRPQDAVGWYSKALPIYAELGRHDSIARVYSNMAMLAYQCGRPEESFQWCAKSVAIKEEQGNLPGVAFTYYRLGLICESAAHFDDAEDLYNKVLALKDRMPACPDVVGSYAQLAMIAERRGQIRAALEMMVRCALYCQEFSTPVPDGIFPPLARFTTALGVESLAQCWRSVSGNPLPDAIRGRVQAAHIHGDG
jgi:tetratricopeptide (TPR) repeat protein